MVRWTTCEEYSLTGLRSREGTQRGLEWPDPTSGFGRGLKLGWFGVKEAGGGGGAAEEGAGLGSWAGGSWLVRGEDQSVPEAVSVVGDRGTLA